VSVTFELTEVTTRRRARAHVFPFRNMLLHLLIQYFTVEYSRFSSSSSSCGDFSMNFLIVLLVEIINR